MKKPLNLLDLQGQKFHRLTALYYAGKSHWVCVCACGSTTTVSTYNLRAGRVKSCGCLIKDASLRGTQLWQEFKEWKNAQLQRTV